MTALRPRRAAGRSRSRDLREQRSEGSFDRPVYELIAAVDRCRRRDGLPTVPTSRLWEVIRSLGYRQLSPVLAAAVTECLNPDCRVVFLQDGRRFCDRCHTKMETETPGTCPGPGAPGIARFGYRRKE